MRGRKKERALRVLLSALIGSDLSRSEIMDLLDALTFGDFGQEFRHLVMNTMQNLTETDRARLKPSLDQPEAEEIYTILQRRRMPKSAFINLLTSISPRRTYTSEGASLRDIVDNFVTSASSVEIRAVLRSLNERSGSDAYLRGITQKR